MDSEQGKLFIGGISMGITEERMKDYFSMFGEVREAEIKKDRFTGLPRGFGFLLFADPAVADRVLSQSKHNIDGQMVEVKKAMSRDEHQMSRSSSVGRSQIRTNKIFVGGLGPTVTEHELRKYFEHFGTITDLVVMYDSSTQRPRGFGFVVYDSEDVVDRIVERRFHQLNGKAVEVKRSIPKAAISSGRGPNGHGFNSTPVPPMNAPQGGGGGYSFYGPPTPMGGGGSYGGGGPSYGTSSSGISYGGAPVSYGGGGPVAYGAGNWENGGYGNTNNATPAGSGNGGNGGYGNTNNAPAPPPVPGGAPAIFPSPVSYGGGGPVAYGAGNWENGGYGNTNIATPAGSGNWENGGYGNSNNATPVGSNMWGIPAMAYGNTNPGSSVEYGSGGITPYGAAGAPVQNDPSNGSSGGYQSFEIDNAAQKNYGYGMGDIAPPYGAAGAQIQNGPSNGSSGGYTSGHQSSEIDSAAQKNYGYGMGEMPFSSASGGYGDTYREIHGSSGNGTPPLGVKECI